MVRLARLAVPGISPHITQGGNRRQPVFFRDADHSHYLALLRNRGARFDVQVRAYCLMESHVHLIAVTETGQSLSRGIGETHRQLEGCKTTGAVLLIPKTKGKPHERNGRVSTVR